MSQVHRCPALLISAPASGQGKTTITAALARLHARRGHRVTVFKCGPDFLDPHWHALASGRPAYQMDLWITGEDDIQRRLHEAAGNSDLILIEGVMGLFDGAPSSADLAEKFRLPVMSVIDASAMAGTFGALAWGLQNYRAHLPWAGVLANRVASTRHAQMLKECVNETSTWLGSVMKNQAATLPERHLGLTVATEIPDAMARLDAVADMLEQTSLGQMSLEDLQRWSVEFQPVPNQAHPHYLAGRTIAVARDAAFCFIYQANLDVLTGLGASLRFFSPMHDLALPECDALWLPGGYPELHAQDISHNIAMRDSVRLHVSANKPVWAECGGMMVLFDELVSREGDSHAMWGLLPGKARMQARLAGLGPHQLELGREILRGHTFHYSLAETGLSGQVRTSRCGTPDIKDGEAFYQVGPIRASYFHPWFASNPGLAAKLFL